MSSRGKYSLVKLREKDGTLSHCIVPSNWIEGKSCYWPPKGVNRSKKLKECALPDADTWLVYEVVKVKYSGDYETCEEYDDQFRTDSDINSKKALQKKKTRTKTYSEMPKPPEDSQDFHVSSMDGKGTLPGGWTMPKPLVEVSPRRSPRKSVVAISPRRSPRLSPKKVTPRNSQDARSSRDVNLGVSPDTVTPGPSCRAAPSCSSGRNNSYSSGRNYAEVRYPMDEADFQRTVIRALANLDIKVSNLEKTIATLVGEQEFNSKKKEYYSTLDDFMEFNGRVSSDKKEYAKLVKQFYGHTANSLNQLVNNMLLDITNNGVLSLFNSAGRCGKSSFKSLRIYDALQEAVKKREKGTSSEKVLAALQAVLKQAPYRKGGAMEGRVSEKGKKNKEKAAAKVTNEVTNAEDSDKSEEESSDDEPAAHNTYKRKRINSDSSVASSNY